MTRLQELLETTVRRGTVPGVAALVARGEDVEIAGVGEVEPESIVRIASITKPITAAGVMLLVDDGLVALDDPIARWLPELASPLVVRTPQSAIDDVVPARRPITVEDVLTFRAGWGFPSDFSLPAIVPCSGRERCRMNGSRRLRRCRCSASPVRHGSTTRAPTSRAC